MKAKKIIELIGEQGNLSEQDFGLYDLPGADKAAKELAKELDDLSKSTMRQIEKIAGKYRKFGAKDTASMEVIFPYFKEKIDYYSYLLD